MTALRMIATIGLIGLDAIAGGIIGAFATTLFLLIFSNSGYAWLFALALGLIILSTGVADRFLLSRRKDDTQSPARTWRRLAFCAGFGVGAWSILQRFDILGRLAP
ncbi:hypothetical protein [Jannaschia sp. CCS1]|uniref:hypothetical protein n=1 Tax=Jannaschia sp. (strain CCS1) TaxID=290400 RepID=UPI000053B407|nr:hypothetical protein [Jannaschia sp. CCS1]ABD53848.1 hypothetical protein Jann_0931 [Jannaschia sp. CCS1]